MPQKIGVGVIGLGMASLPHGKSLAALAGRVDVRGVFSPNPERRRAFAERFALPAAERLEDVVDDPAIAAVLLLTPPNARAPLVSALAAAGKHILMEKPIERTTAAAEAIVASCAEAGLKLGIVFQHRFRDGALALRQRLRDGELGEIEAVRLAVPWWRPQSYYDEPGRGTFARDGGGVLLSQAIHSMDLMLSLAGPVREVTAIAGTTGLHHMESEDFVGGALRFENGAFGTIAATTANYPGGTETLTINATRATATLTGGTLDIAHLNGRTEQIGEATGSGGGADPMDFPHIWHQRLITDFLDAVDAGREPPVTGHQALAVHRLIDALLLSSVEKRHVRL